MSVHALDGFYTVFFSGTGGEGYAVFIFDSGLITGADPLGVIFDGEYRIENERVLGQVNVKAPPFGTLIQGIQVGSAGLEYAIGINLPLGFVGENFSRIETPVGPVNARFKKLRDLRA